MYKTYIYIVDEVLTIQKHSVMYKKYIYIFIYIKKNQKLPTLKIQPHVFMLLKIDEKIT